MDDEFGIMSYPLSSILASKEIGADPDALLFGRNAILDRLLKIGTTGD